MTTRVKWPNLIFHHLLFIMNRHSTLNFTHHWKNISIIIYDRYYTRTKHKNRCNCNWKKKKFHHKKCNKFSQTFRLPKVTEYAAISCQFGVQMYAFLSKLGCASVHRLGQHSIAADIHVKHIQHWHLVFVWTVSYLKGLRTAVNEKRIGNVIKIFNKSFYPSLFLIIEKINKNFTDLSICRQKSTWR